MLNIQNILEILPHRYPFLMVDGVTEVGEDRILAYKNVSFNEPHFRGHFPGLPVMPGVLVVESMAQAGAILAHQTGGFDPQRQVVYFLTIDKAKFRAQVKPGDRLELEVTPMRRGSSVWRLRGEARVDGKVVASAELMATIADREHG